MLHGFKFLSPTFCFIVSVSASVLASNGSLSVFLLLLSVFLFYSWENPELISNMDGRETQLSSSDPKCGGAAEGFTLGGGGWILNLIIYLIQVFNLKNINTAQISNIVSGSTNLLPVIGAIVADSFFGTFSVATVSAISLCCCSSEGNTDGIGDCGVLRGGDDRGVVDGMVVLAIGLLETMMVGL
nr:protein nrt1/ ptr family 2.7 [Quercus suber]